eukprot:TRINITY_DN400_c1_g1_i1.p1 TRINITY_DN400_c1_g1~~TRINITY_DN400_c1_g1_i1.p1  ORF type:complete len:580 (+),score=162.15 TRINITY_DN400_c1_g1_i1:47-1786(+)
MESVQSHPICQFDERQKQFAIVSDSTVKIYNVATGKLTNTLSLPNSMTHLVSCIGWCKGTSVIGVGCKSGQAYLWDADKDEEVAELSLQQEVTDIKFHGTRAFVSGSSVVKIYDTKSKSESECEIPKGARGMAVSPSGSLMVAGSKKLSVLQCDAKLKKLSVLGKFTGHSSPASLVQFLDEKRFVTGCEDERHLSMWDATAEGNKIKSLKEFQLPHPPVALWCQGNIVMCLTSASTVHLWDVSNSASSPAGDCVVTLKEGTSSILAAATFSMKGSKHLESILVAKGTQAAPCFEPVRVSEENNTFLPNVSISPAENTQLMKPTKKRKSEQSEAVPMPSEPTDTATLDKTLSQFQSLGFKKEELMRREGRVSAQERVKITQSLQQALARNDKRQLDSLLEEGLSKRLIDVSVMGLDRQYTLQLLRECTKRFQDKSSRSQITMAWIRAVLAHHPQHLLSLPDLDKLLEPLQNVVSEHLKTYNQLAVLQGRLDVVLGRSFALKDTVAREKGLPLKVVSEADSRMARDMLPDSFDDEDDEDSDMMGEDVNGDVVMAEGDSDEEGEEDDEGDEEEEEEEEEKEN